MLPATLPIHHPERKHDKSDFIRFALTFKTIKVKADINQTFYFHHFVRIMNKITNEALQKQTNKQTNQQQWVLLNEKKEYINQQFVLSLKTMIKIGNWKQDCQISSAVEIFLLSFFSVWVVIQLFNENIMNVLMYSSRSYHQ